MARMISDGGSPIERKVQVTGGSTYTISIPKSWANDHDIGSGSLLHLYPFENRLVVARPNGELRVRRAVINVDTVGRESIANQISAAYAAGSDEVIIESDTGLDSADRRIASEAIIGLVGIEIATETDYKLVARSLVDSTEISLQATNDQLRQISLSMHENAVRALLQDGDESEDLARHVVSRDNDADRLFALVSRQFYRALTDVREIDKLQSDRQIAFTQFRTARQLERVADHAELIAEIAIRQTGPPEAELSDRFDSAAEDARRVVRTAIDGDTRGALRRRDTVVEQLETLDREMYESDDDNVYLYGRVLESIRRTAEYGGNIAEIITLAEITEGR